MSKFAVVCFCYGGDAPALRCLAQRVAHISDARLYFIDDSAFPCDAETVEELSSMSHVRWEVGDFARGGTLNGRECVQGILRTMHRVAVEEAVDFVVKIDADVLPVSFAFLSQGSHARYIGFEGGHSCRPSGMIYAIDQALLGFLCEKVANWKWQEKDHFTPEDATIGMLAAMNTNRGEYLLHPWNRGEYVSNMTVQAIRQPWKLWPKTAVHFGQRELVEAYPCPRGVLLKRLMSAWVKHTCCQENA